MTKKTKFTTPNSHKTSTFFVIYTNSQVQFSTSGIRKTHSESKKKKTEKTGIYPVGNRPHISDIRKIYQQTKEKNNDSYNRIADHTTAWSALYTGIHQQDH